ATDGSVSADPAGSAGTPASPASAPSADSAPSAGSAPSAQTPSAGAPSAETPSAETPLEPPGTTPAVRLEGLGLRGSRGWAFRDVDLVAQPGDLVVITGASGTGRSTLLLAIAGRLQPTAGSLEVAGCTVAADRRNHRALKRVRERVAVARLADHICLDGNLSVQTNARDAADWVRQRPADVQDRLEDWRARSGLVLEPHTSVSELPALEATALHLLLAAVVGPEVIVLDDADAGLVPAERDQLWQLAAEVAATGTTVIATATGVPDQADVHLVLHRHSGPAAHVASSPPAEAPETPQRPPDAQRGSPSDQPESPPEREQQEPPADPDRAGRPDTDEPDQPEPDEPDQPEPDQPDQPGTDRDGAER